MIYRKGLFNPLFGAFRVALRKLDSEMIRSLTELDANLEAIFDKGLTFEENFDSVYVTYTSHATPGTETTVSHDLGRVPTGYIPVTKNKTADVFNTTAPDKDNLYLKSNVASAEITLLVF